MSQQTPNPDAVGVDPAKVEMLEDELRKRTNEVESQREMAQAALQAKDRELQELHDDVAFEKEKREGAEARAQELESLLAKKQGKISELELREEEFCKQVEGIGVKIQEKDNQIRMANQ